MALFRGHGYNSSYFKIDSSGLGPVSLVDLGAVKLINIIVNRSKMSNTKPTQSRIRSFQDIVLTGFFFRF